MNFKTHAPARREGTTLQPNIRNLYGNVGKRRTFCLERTKAFFGHIYQEIKNWAADTRAMDVH